MSSSPLVITSPANGSTITTGTVQLNATSSLTGSFVVYDNGKQVYSHSRVSSISVPLTLTSGNHTLKVQQTTSGVRGKSYIASVTVFEQTVAPPIPPSPSTDVGVEIAADMQGSNEAYPEGVPLSYDWANGPVMVMGNNSNGWKAMTAWGLVYAAAQGNPATNTRVNIRDMQAWILSKSTGKWTLGQNTSIPDGAAYLDDFSGDVSKPADVRKEPDGSISVTAGGGYNFHFYPDTRASVNPSDIGGIVTIFEARLIVGNPSLPDDRATANYLCGSGGDYYPALTGGWPSNLGDANPGIAGGKLKYVKTDWRMFSMTTLSAAQLDANLPPIDLTGILP